MEVELVSKGYEWTCPECGCLNETEEMISSVRCDSCDKEYTTYG